MTSVTNHAEQSEKKILATPSSGEYLVVRRPRKVESLLMVLTDLENFSERIAEDHSHDLGGGTAVGTAAITGDDVGTQVSPRAQVQKKLPSSQVMRVRLTHHLEKDIRKLERRALLQARHGGPGSAYVLNELYAKIRKLQAFIVEIARSTMEMLERLYMRVFVDKQELV